MSKEEIIDMIVKYLNKADYDKVRKAYYMLTGFLG